jgi:Asp-tRNA(Asn)/Glu-tRNA(Gln) amidotransferase C subunit
MEADIFLQWQQIIRIAQLEAAKKALEELNTTIEQIIKTEEK